MKNEYQDIFMKLSETKKKKGGSLGAVFKLIQELTDFESKIQECAEAQEMTENRTKIESFLGDLDRMYETLFEMAKGGVQSIRSDRQAIMPEEVETVEGVGEEEVVESVPVRPSSLNVPQAPSM